MKGYKITRDKFLSTDEVKVLLKTCQDQSILDLARGRRLWVTRYMLVHLALHSGLRVSELAALTIGDLHLGGRETYLVVQKGKGGKKRDVYLDREIVRHLKEYIQLKSKSWDEPIDKGSPLFLGQGGGHYSTTALYMSFKRAIEAAGLPKHYTIHSARHTYATILLARTSNLRFVQKQLGHSSISTSSLYADVLPEHNQSLADSLIE